jgi:Protein of unknown function (DUF2510)
MVVKEREAFARFTHLGWTQWKDQRVEVVHRIELAATDCHLVDRTDSHAIFSVDGGGYVAVFCYPGEKVRVPKKAHVSKTIRSAGREHWNEQQHLLASYTATKTGPADEFAAYRGLASGWYRDKADRSMARYWDGVRLSDERRPVAEPRAS